MDVLRAATTSMVRKWARNALKRGNWGEEGYGSCLGAGGYAVDMVSPPSCTRTQVVRHNGGCVGVGVCGGGEICFCGGDVLDCSVWIHVVTAAGAAS
ncbi:hypothetical protein POVWA1_009960 [Plasmodium ovale wallikeri]|uniref:Uncharacterized protein n=1 Tax=Plasmodium ovale wallikeri TaxID=864142 RepID=A0A1A8YKB7_PLAOA|nr:hypothetical protein POVWA1_009960 [Plasmodium ovale wallikeri]